MALAWKAGWVNSPRGFESRILRQLETGSDLRKRRCRSDRSWDGVASNIEAASLSSGLNSRRPICRNPAFRRLGAFAEVRRHVRRLTNPLQSGRIRVRRDSPRSVPSESRASDCACQAPAGSDWDCRQRHSFETHYRSRCPTSPGRLGPSGAEAAAVVSAWQKVDALVRDPLQSPVPAIRRCRCDGLCAFD
jgi:hypothetical protein